MTGMPVRRVYLPLTRSALVALARDGELAAPLRGHAVTPQLPRGILADEEGAEYAAWQRAAKQAGKEAEPGTRRIVAAADVPGELVGELAAPDDPSAIEITQTLPLRRFVSFHVDEEPGGGDADLLWYDATELRDVLALASP